MPGDAPTRPIVKLDDVERVYKMGEVEVHALQHTHLEIPRGEFVAVLGPSGSGKTTLLNLIGGIDSPTSGTVVIDGQDIAKHNRRQLTYFRREKVGFVFQFFNLIPTLTAKENVQFALELAARDGVPSGLDAGELLDSVGLGDRKDHFPSQLSGGEQQRVAVARALAKDPVLILGDEPTGNLDFRTGKLVLKALRDVNREQGKTVIIVTHNSPMAAVADRVLHLRDGAVTQIDVNEHPVEPEDVVW
ncbi:MAG: ABC transporter ATP-binding protein [Actinobacteria bacterium]|nr:MAG: ABC transporter ATP-binding protein [Actinomycetota bacterium]